MSGTAKSGRKLPRLKNEHIKMVRKAGLDDKYKPYFKN
jgi:hypothetical protein